ncbi:methyl-CpG-binding domain-containing protein [Stylosanthes scabra]|uniref:Methyl-CpG-binding domain-containing protein n=1 Tax=Stylosanthes scabra TaxID=79078 RepID=A0ABU6WAC4_9FABA|nr:methyl-CpG-binding domain-containing protein [Stylosanthes scabra]
MATRKSLRKRRNRLPVSTIADLVEEEQEEEDEEEEKREMEMQIVCFSPHHQYQHPFTLPPGWIIERKRRPSNPSQVDKYYHEPGTGKKFRSLVEIQRYLLQKQISHHQNTTCIESATPKQRFRSLRNVDAYLSPQTPSPPTPTPNGPPTHANQSECAFTTYRRVLKKRYSHHQQHEPTPQPVRHSFPSMHADKSDSPNKESRKDKRGYIHNLAAPPEKVTWVLSGPGGFWSPFVDDSIVSESEKLKWSEAFVLSIHNNR